MLGAGKLSLFAALTGRLYYLQVIKGNEFQTASDQNRIRLSLTLPERGLIRDRNGIILASNEQNYRLYGNKETLRDYPGRIGIIAEIVGQDSVLIKERLDAHNFGHSRVLLAEHLSWKQVSRLEVRKPELPGITVEVGQVRFYPYDVYVSHIVGYVGAPNEKDGDPAFFRRLPELKVGKRGIEIAYEESLRGKPGMRQEEVNAHGHVLNEKITQPSQPGENRDLTIDMRLQQIVHDRLMQEKSASAVIMHIRTGEILALGSHPGYDPNHFSKGISTKDWNALLADVRTPLMNKSIAGQYPPGSTFKMLTALAALDSGKYHGGIHHFCPGYLHVGNRRFHCWKREGHGHLNMEEAIKQSCDIYFYQIALKIGFDPVAAMARRFGMGSKLGIEIPGEQPGIMPDSDWKRAAYGQPWQKGDSVNSSIGQGYVLATPLQLASMTAAFANGGTLITPTIIKQPQELLPLDKQDTKVPRSHIALIQRAMAGVTGSPTGTAYYRRIKEEQYAMAGKTGTSQVRSLKKLAGLAPSQIPWHYNHHALFVGFAPVHDPKYACAVVVEHGGGGSKAAAPVAHDILLAAQTLPPFEPDAPDTIPLSKETEEPAA